MQSLYQETCACADANAVCNEPTISESERGLITHQTGHLLVTLGNMFASLPAFNANIDQNTAEMLIAVGRKLKASKR